MYICNYFDKRNNTRKGITTATLNTRTLKTKPNEAEKMEYDEKVNRFTKQYIENQRLNNTNTTNNSGIQVHQ